jgi:hypothetical protein
LFSTGADSEVVGEAVVDVVGEVVGESVTGD